MNMVLFEYLCIPEHSRIAHVYIVWAHFWVVSSFSCCYILYLLILFFYLYSCCYIDSLLLFNILKPSQPGYNIFCDENWSIWPEVAQLPFAKENMFKWITIPFVINPLIAIIQIMLWHHVTKLIWLRHYCQARFRHNFAFVLLCERRIFTTYLSNGSIGKCQ